MSWNDAGYGATGGCRQPSAAPRATVQLDHDGERPGALRPVETREQRRAGVTDVLDVLYLDVVAHDDLLARLNGLSAEGPAPTLRQRLTLSGKRRAPRAWSQGTWSRRPVANRGTAPGFEAGARRAALIPPRRPGLLKPDPVTHLAESNGVRAPAVATSSPPRPEPGQTPHMLATVRRGADEAHRAWPALPPELRCRQASAVRHRAELGPHDAGMDLRMIGGLR